MVRFPPCLCNYALLPPSPILCSSIFVPSSQFNRGFRLIQGVLLDQERLRSERKGCNLHILGWVTLGLITHSLHQSLSLAPVHRRGSHLYSLSTLFFMPEPTYSSFLTPALNHHKNGRSGNSCSFRMIG